MSGTESWEAMIARVALDCQEELREAVDALKIARAKAHIRDVRDGHRSRGLIENPGLTDLNLLDLLTDAEVCTEVGDFTEADEILEAVRRVVVPAPGNSPGEGLGIHYLESEIQEAILEADRVIDNLHGLTPDPPGDVLREADRVIEKLNGLVGIVEKGEQPPESHPPPIDVAPAASRLKERDDIQQGSQKAGGPFSWARRLLRRAGVSMGSAYAGRMVDLLEANSLGDDYPIWGRIESDHPRVLDFWDSTGAVVTRPDGSPLDPAQSFQVADISTGFERNGDGPGQIAFAIILDHTGSPHMAERLYRKPNDSVFARLPMNRPWSLPNPLRYRELVDFDNHLPCLPAPAGPMVLSEANA